MMRTDPLNGLALLSAVAIVGCADKAQPAYEECVRAEANGDLTTATKSCESAAAADPNSKAGKAASEKIGPLKVRLAAKAKADAEAKAAAEAARIAEDKRRQSIMAEVAFYIMKPGDGDDLERYPVLCTGKGLPPVYVSCRHATDPLNGPKIPLCAELASLVGCKPTWSPEAPVQFCCPKGVAQRSF